jgi:hypothetical protein
MPIEATCTYENVETAEAAIESADGSPPVSRGTVRRCFQGEISGESVADVLIARGAADRLGYVATDRFTGRIGDRAGSFVFQHGGTIDRGALTPFGYVVPGSGTAQLAGLAGQVIIQFIPPATHSLTLRHEFED